MAVREGSVCQPPESYCNVAGLRNTFPARTAGLGTVVARIAQNCALNHTVPSSKVLTEEFFAHWDGFSKYYESLSRLPRREDREDVALSFS